MLKKRPPRRDPIAARSTTRVLAVSSTIPRCALAHSQDAAKKINDSEGNPIVCDKALLLTGLLDFSFDTVAEVVLFPFLALH